jgi:hypothetical protein
VSMAVSRGPVSHARRWAYLDRTCVLRVEVDYGLAAAGDLDLVLRAEPRHDCIVLWSACLLLGFGADMRGAPLIVLLRAQMLAASRAHTGRATYDMAAALSSAPALRPHSYLLVRLTLCRRVAASPGGAAVVPSRSRGGARGRRRAVKAPLLLRGGDGCRAARAGSS